MRRRRSREGKEFGNPDVHFIGEYVHQLARCVRYRKRTFKDRFQADPMVLALWNFPLSFALHFDIMTSALVPICFRHTAVLALSRGPNRSSRTHESNPKNDRKKRQRRERQVPANPHRHRFRNPQQ